MKRQGGSADGECGYSGSKSQEAIAHQELGRLLVYRGKWAETAEELDTALTMFEQQNNTQGQCNIWTHLALESLLRVRVGVIEAAVVALSAAGRSLELAEETVRTQRPYPRDFVRAYWLLGAAHRVSGNLSPSDTHLSNALTRCRTIDMVDHEADILLYLARLLTDQGQAEEALRLAQEALIITDRCGYVLQGADVRLFLARRVLAGGERGVALGYAREARRLAEGDGGEFVYRVAYDEAGALLAENNS
ncbi:MAG: tetratricopeptide repeat protein [Leptolyngbyaceae bacterium]|nr:tetratricopeptide repeat protein [Leptolyngbyaceae bacterium]